MFIVWSTCTFLIDDSGFSLTYVDLVASSISGISSFGPESKHQTPVSADAGGARSLFGQKPSSLNVQSSEIFSVKLHNLGVGERQENTVSFS